MNRDTLNRVVDCLAEVTRYPTQLLTVEADLANDLGIDSVKRVEIVLALGEAFGIDLQAEQSDPSIRTIGDVAHWIEGFLQTDPADSQSSPGSPGSTPETSRGTKNGTDSLSREPFRQDIAQQNTAHSESITRDSGTHQRNDGATRRSDPVRQVLPGPHYSPVRPSQSSADRVSARRPLESRIALVTGSGRGIGRTTARLLADRGAHVVVNSFHSRDDGEKTVADIVSRGGLATHLWGSVANPEHVERMFDQIRDQWGGLDILVCNASDGKIGSFLDITPDDWDRAFRTNVAGHHHCAIRAAQLMRPRGGGAIVTMSAVGAHQYISGLGSQGVVKAAVESMTRYLACELGRSGIRVNCVVGGPVYGDLLDEFPSARAKQNHWEAMTPDGELSNPMDLAETIAFLVSDQARGVNGAVWMVDRGFSANADGQPLQGLSRAFPTATLGANVSS